MTRVISVCLPTLSTDRVRRKAGDTAPPPETPLILVGRDGRRRVVLAADAAAQAVGVRVGVPASKAQALVQGLVIQDANPAANSEALERLAFWILQRVAPIVAADPPDGVVIDAAGADHLHGGEAATLAMLVEKLAGVGLRARAAIADTWGAAHALARFDARPSFVSGLNSSTRPICRPLAPSWRPSSPPRPTGSRSCSPTTESNSPTCQRTDQAQPPSSAAILSTASVGNTGSNID